VSISTIEKADSIAHLAARFREVLPNAPFAVEKIAYMAASNYHVVIKVPGTVISPITIDDISNEEWSKFVITREEIRVGGRVYYRDINISTNFWFHEDHPTSSDGYSSIFPKIMVSLEDCKNISDVQASGPARQVEGKILYNGRECIFNTTFDPVSRVIIKDACVCDGNTVWLYELLTNITYEAIEGELYAPNIYNREDGEMFVTRCAEIGMGVAKIDSSNMYLVTNIISNSAAELSGMWAGATILSSPSGAVSAGAMPYIGVGAFLRKASNSVGVVVSSIVRGSPAELAGLLEGDVVLRIDGRDASNMSIGEAVRAIRGPSGSEVEITYQRNSNQVSVVIPRSDIGRQ
jgi:hypothetical protein